MSILSLTLDSASKRTNNSALVADRNSVLPEPLLVDMQLQRGLGPLQRDYRTRHTRKAWQRYRLAVVFDEDADVCVERAQVQRRSVPKPRDGRS